MSWSGFKKNVGRATTQVMMKTGHVEKTSDRSYEVEERRYRTLESAANRLQKEAKGYLDSLRAMTASQMRIAETIDAFYGDSGAQDGVSKSYKQAVEDLDAETVKALDGPYRYIPQSSTRGSIDVEEIERLELEGGCWVRSGAFEDRTLRAAEGEEYRLMEEEYRTAVLEPIDRFCAYFPDVNECIKKRNHKLLDYDAMRAKVKKLIEKPDKDPGKLPRTEKETEMVYNPDFSSATRPSARRIASCDGEERIINKRLLSLRRSSSSARSRSVESERLAPTIEPPASIEEESENEEKDFNDMSFEIEPFPPFYLSPEKPNPTPQQTMIDTTTADAEDEDDVDDAASPGPPDPDSPLAHKSQPSTYSLRTMIKLTPAPAPPNFFSIDELEAELAPLKAKYIHDANERNLQSKAAYDQINDQLTQELPQLIDLRVPYLDPSFEALVKIQLRFCAEAYSRMAQVQQYLDASTRDQYASGDLDARVEDVLGQIRELSIAGTV